MNDFKQLIDHDVRLVDACIEKELIDLGDDLDPLLKEVLHYCLFNGGKRVRPLLVILAARLCGQDNEQVFRLAAAFEYLHVATLLHDDVIDRADTRRGKPSVNAAYDLVAAILAGDFLHAYSMKIVGQLSGQAGIDVFCEATLGMVDGEFVQLRNALQYDLSQQKYFAAIHGKTARLISAACEVGAIFADGTGEQRQALKTYGSNLGAAFQIIDDILDYKGDANVTGKLLGNDLVEGKVTLPLILCLENADFADRQEIMKMLQEEESRQEHFADMVTLMDKYDSFGLAGKQAEKLIFEAVNALAVFPAEKMRDVEILKGLASYVLSRNK